MRLAIYSDIHGNSIALDAVLTAIQGQVSDLTGSINLSFFVPVACFANIAFYAIYESQKDLPGVEAS